MAEQEYKGLHFKPDSVNPQGKQKVYFCCHEADFSSFLEPIMEEIRAIQPNVTFWYYDPAEGIPSGEAFFADLSQMQLFVIPVTYRFIYQDTPARTVEIGRASCRERV